VFTHRHTHRHFQTGAKEEEEEEKRRSVFILVRTSAFPPPPPPPLSHFHNLATAIAYSIVHSMRLGRLGPPFFYCVPKKKKKKNIPNSTKSSIAKHAPLCTSSYLFTHTTQTQLKCEKRRQWRGAADGTIFVCTVTPNVVRVLLR